VRIAFLNWRDSTHPEGGGAEKYAETVCRGLAARGHDVTLLCAHHTDSPTDEVVEGVRVLRQGGRLGVYAASVRRLRRLERAEGAFDVVIDTQNGLPFWAALGTRSPVVVLVHHVHREQWPIVFGPITARAGWLIESVVAPRVLGRHQYVAVSQQTKHELGELGVPTDRVAVIHNGTDEPTDLDVPKSEVPSLVVLGRLVPHKRVEHAVQVLARLLAGHPDLHLRVVGDGWWAEHIRTEARRLGVEHRVELLGHVDERAKNVELARAWVHLAPSIKEGWGLSVVEAASHATPTVAYQGSGGLSESIVDGSTGALVADLDDMASTVERLLHDRPLLAALGAAAQDHAARFTWKRTIEAWEVLLLRVSMGVAPVGTTDATEPGDR